MALVTRCPDCFTVFRVTPLHLQAHGGKVRCGQCNHIFDGFAALLSMEEPETIKPVKTGEAAKAPESTSQLSPDVAMSHAEALQDRGVPEPMRLEPHISEPIPSAQNPSEPHTSEPAGVAPVKPEAAEARAPEAPAREKPDSRAARKADRARDRRVAREQISQTGDAMYAGPEDDMLDNYLPEHYASRGKQLPEITAAWVIANLFMLFVLVAQVIYLFRSELVVSVPATRPFLEQYCKVLQCTVSLPPSSGPENTASSGMTSGPSVDLAAPADKRSSVSGHYRHVHSPSPIGRIA
jgi:predicted Zn finger-like uncharacterized protein